MTGYDWISLDITGYDWVWLDTMAGYGWIHKDYIWKLIYACISCRIPPYPATLRDIPSYPILFRDIQAYQYIDLYRWISLDMTGYG
jgi:hypothetical protein